MMGADGPATLHKGKNCGFTRTASANMFPLVPMLIFLDTTDESFVHFNGLSFSAHLVLLTSRSHCLA